MAELKLTSEIVDQNTQVCLAWDGFNSTSSDDIVNFIDSIPSDDTKITLRINCPGGNVWEGWRMYDALRHSNKEITAVVEGMCASMATVVLMAAPKERRYSYANASFLIHNPEASYISTDWYQRLTADNIDAMADKMKLQAEMLRTEQQKILDLYVERTGSDADTLQKLMDEDIVINTEKAKELGLIADTLAPNTASANNNFKNHISMSKENNVEVGKSWLSRLVALAGFKSVEDVHFNDLSFTAADGRTFAVEREEGLYAIGDMASPDGSYVMEDGSTVNIVNGKIDEIVAAAFEIKNPETGNVMTNEEAQHLINELCQMVKDLKAELENTKNASVEENAKNTETIDALNATIAEMTAKLEESNAKVAEFEANALDDEQKGMLAQINEAGGKDWFDKVIAMQSNGAPQVPQSASNIKFGDEFIADAQKASRRFRIK